MLKAMKPMAKVFRPGDRAGWYYMLEMRRPVGPFRTKKDAMAALRVAGGGSVRLNVALMPSGI